MTKTLVFVCVAASIDKTVYKRKVFALEAEMRRVEREGVVTDLRPHGAYTRTDLVQSFYDLLENTTHKCVRTVSGVFDPSIFDVRECSGGAHVGGSPRGLIASRDLPFKHCLGEYAGDEYMSFEFNAKYPTECPNWYYSMRVNYKGGVVVIDGKGPLAFFNDARHNMSMPDLAAEDRARHNIDIVYCTTTDRLVPYVVTLRPVTAGEELRGYYGPDYVLDNDQLASSAKHCAAVPTPQGVCLG